MDLLKQLNNAILFVEESLLSGDQPDLERAAKMVGLSEPSFHRLFSSLANIPLAEYIRRRKMTLATDDLRRTSYTVLDIAIKYGYKSADAFSRAFRSQHSISPSVYRKHGGFLKLYPPISFQINTQGGREMNCRLIHRKEIALYGISREYDLQKYPTHEALRSNMWDETSENIPRKICSGAWNHPTNNNFDGIWYGVWKEGKYFIGREQADVSFDSLEQVLLPAGQYIAFSTKPGGLAWEDIPSLTAEIFNSWLPNSTYQLVNETIIEVYHLWTDRDTRQKKRYFEIWLQVEEKTAEP